MEHSDLHRAHNNILISGFQWEYNIGDAGLINTVDDIAQE